MVATEQQKNRSKYNKSSVMNFFQFYHKNYDFNCGLRVLEQARKLPLFKISHCVQDVELLPSFSEVNDTRSKLVWIPEMNKSQILENQSPEDIYF